MGGFRMNPTFIPTLARSPGIARVVKDDADEVLKEAQAHAPVFAGHYREGLRVELVVEDGTVRGRVIADDPTGAGGLIEFGSINNPAFAPLRKGLAAVLGSDAGVE